MRSLFESGLIGLGILSFWPWILGYRPVWYQVALVVMLALLAVLAVVRFKRVQRAIANQKELAVQTRPVQYQEIPLGQDIERK